MGDEPMVQGLGFTVAQASSLLVLELGWT